MIHVIYNSRDYTYIIVHYGQNDIILDLKHQIDIDSDIPIGAQSIYLYGRSLENNTIVNDLILEDSTTLLVLVVQEVIE